MSKQKNLSGIIFGFEKNFSLKLLLCLRNMLEDLLSVEVNATL
jgi:hypothetical protein